MRVEPPTSTTSSTWLGAEARVLERAPARLERPRRRSGAMSASNSARVMCARVAVRRGPARRRPRCRVSSNSERSHFAWMTALRTAWTASAWRRRIEAEVAATICRPAARSMSSPPRCVSPLVDEHLEHAVLDLEDRDVEGAAAEVVDGDDALVALVEAVGQARRRRLVDDAQHLEAGQAPGVARGRALRVVEVGRHRDDRRGRPRDRSRPRAGRTPRRGASARAG